MIFGGKKLKRYLFFIILLISPLLLYVPTQALAKNIKGTVKVKGLRSPADILVYVTHAQPLTMDLSKTTFVMDQKNLAFLPHILPIPLGSTVMFPNNDQVDHNVFSLSRTKAFNLGSYQPGEIKSIQFDKAGIVELRCDVHAEMLAYIMVLKNPFFAVTDAKGEFEIPDPELLAQFGIREIDPLPSGSYVIKTRHEKLKTKKQTVVIPDEGSVSIHLDLTRGTPSVLYK